MPKDTVSISQFFLKINGKPASTQLMNDIMEIVVEDNLHLPDMFSIQLHDKAGRWTGADLFEVGNEIEISAQAPDPQSKQLGPRLVLMQGEITGLEPDLFEDGVPSVVVRGYDRSHRLHQGRQTRSFLETTDSELAQKIADEVGLKAEATPTNIIHEHITQNNQTNMEFLAERAKRLGYRLYVESETLYFGPATANGAQPPKLTWGLNLLSFRPSLTTVSQVDEVVVRSWDPMTKREIVGRASESESMPNVKSRTKSDQRFKGVNQRVVSQPVHSQAEADALAQAMRDEIGGDLIQADGVCMGEPRVKAGQPVEIEQVGKQFDGEYVITQATHTYQADEGYETSFSIGGGKADTLTSLLEQTGGGNELGRGVMVGLVTNNKDPEEMGRIKVKYPGLDDIDESPWVRIAAPMAGEQRGFYCLPEVNDEVLIAFEQGDIHRPYMVGMLWNGSDKPPEANSAVVGGDGRVNQRIFRSRSGHEIILDDTDSAEKIIIADKTGQNQITIDSATNKVSITAASEMSIEVQGNLSIEATGKITMKGASIDLN